MKQSWIVGIVALWVILTLMSNVARQEALMAQIDPVTELTQVETMDTMMKPAGTDIQNPLTFTVSIITKVWDYIKIFFQVILLYYPEIWQGGAMIIYYTIFLPVGIAFATTVVMIIRGVGSS